ERVDQDVTAVEAELREEALQPVAGLTDKNSAGDRLVLRRVLADHEHARAAVEPAAVKNRPPLNPKVLAGIDVRRWIVLAQAPERFGGVAGVELLCHLDAPKADGAPTEVMLADLTRFHSAPIGCRSAPQPPKRLTRMASRSRPASAGC